MIFMEKIIINEQDVLIKYNELKNIHKVAQYFKISTSPVRRILNSVGVDLTNRRYEVNHNFFDNYFHNYF